MIRRALVLALVLAAPAAAQTIAVRLGGGLSSFTGMPFDVPIEVDWTARPDRLGSFSLAIRWNSGILRMDGGSPGSFGDAVANDDSVAQGVFRLTGANPMGAAGVITLGVPRFTPLTAATTTTIQIELTELYASGPTFPDVLGFASVQNGLYCAARGYWGDPDLDRISGSRDALLALSAAVGLDVSGFPEIGLADVDNDGLIRARDALITLSHAVGLDVSAFRIMRIAVGSCATDEAVSYAVAPDTGTVPVNQELAFTLSATTGTASRTMPDVFWRSSNTGVLVVLSDGRAFSVGPGTATVTGKSGLRDSATATITVARRPRHIVEATAAGSAIRLGNSEYPYASIGEAGDVAQDGDTVLIRPGRYLEEAFFDRGVVILGAALGVRILGRGQDATAITFFGSGTSEVRNVTIDSASTGINAFGPFGGTPGRLRVTDVTMNDVEYGIQTDFTRTRVDKVTLTRGGTGVFVGGGGVDSVTNSTIRDLQYGVYGEDSVMYAGGNIIDRPIYNGILYYGQSTDSVVAVNNQVTCAVGSTAYGIQVSDASHRAQGNTITGCAAGVFLSAFGPPAPLRAVVRGNSVALPATAGGAGIYVSGPFGAEVVGNTVTGGHPREGHGSIVLEGTFYDTLGLARVDSNTIRNAAVTGIRVTTADSTLVRGNVVEDVTGSDGSLFFFDHGALIVANARHVLRIERNTLRRIHTRTGIGVRQTDTARVVIDSNAVSGADSVAIRLDAGVLSMTGNNIRSNARYGLHVATFTTSTHEVHGGAFVGNLLFALQSDNDLVNAQQNWWGQATGACLTGPNCVSGRVDAANFLATDPTASLPPTAPPLARALTASRVTAATTTTSAPPPNREALVAAMRAERERLDALRLEQYRVYREALERRRAEYRSAQ